MSIDVTMVPQVELFQRKNLGGMPNAPNSPAVGGPPTVAAHEEALGDYDGVLYDLEEIATPQFPLQELGNLSGASQSLAQILVNSKMSNETLSLVAEDLNLHEGLTLERTVKTVERVFELGLVEAVAPSMPKQPCILEARSQRTSLLVKGAFQRIRQMEWMDQVLDLGHGSLGNL
jgi:hypothetical protein